MSTKIEWTEETWNPVTGCSKVSQGCKNCYAERIWPKVVGAAAKRNGPGLKGLRGFARPFTDVRTHPDRLDAPLHWKRPRPHAEADRYPRPDLGTGHRKGLMP